MWQNIGGGGHQFLMNVYRGGVIHFSYICVFGKGGVCYFSHPDGEVMHFYHLGIGGVNIFFPYSEALSATSPSTEIYEQSLSRKRQYGIADNSSNKVCKPCIQTIKRMNHAVSWQSAGPNVCMTEATVWLSSRPYSLQPMILVQH